MRYLLIGLLAVVAAGGLLFGLYVAVLVIVDRLEPKRDAW